MQARLEMDPGGVRDARRRHGAALVTAFAAFFVGLGLADGTALRPVLAAADPGVAPDAIGQTPAAAQQPAQAAAAPTSRPAIVESRGNPAFDAARERFARALGHEPAGSGGEIGDRLLVLDSSLANLLVERHWQPPGQAGGSPIERLRTMVEIAKGLQLPVSVGVMQAAFGTPAENDLLELDRAVAQARQALAARPNDRALVRLRDERKRALEAALAPLPVFRKSGRNWALADLDVDRNGVVDGNDLTALESRRDMAAREPAAATAPATAKATE
ncbi:hypothetical protein [Benzoatithermus flavus]|uniref:EF-hand domain-containing protein n=1 Tax=Benzoatithermus flavus TaxID=3108223 RepID=A0ABU8XV92_9PROT